MNTSKPITVAYADPPYIGQARRYYRHDPNCAEVDHAELIGRLMAEFPQGWALSLSAATLKQVLALCPDSVRVLAWVKPYRNFLPGVRLQFGWEPVIMFGGRQGPHVTGSETVVDWLRASPEGFTFRKMPGNHVTGKKPRQFCFWLFSCLGLRPGDTLVDLFPGTGAVSLAWEAYQAHFGRVRYGQFQLFGAV